MVRTQKSFASFAADDRPVTHRFGCILSGERDDVSETLLRTFGLMMLDVFRNGTVQQRFAKEDHPIGAFLFDRPDESFSVGNQIRTSVGQCGGFDADRFKDHVKISRELRVEVTDHLVVHCTSLFPCRDGPKNRHFPA